MDVNKAIISGRLTHDPEIRFTQSGKTICTFQIAVNRYSGEKKKTEVLPIVLPVRIVRDKLGEACSNYLCKGKEVLVEGYIQVRNYEAQDGSKRNVTEVVTQNIKFFGHKEKNEKKDESTFSANSFGQEFPDEEILF